MHNPHQLPASKGDDKQLTGDLVLSPEIRFLAGRHLEIAELENAERLARLWGTTAEQVLFSTGKISERDYYQALAAHAGLNFTDLENHPPDWTYFKRIASRALGQGDIAPLGTGVGGLQIAYAPRGTPARRLARMADSPELGQKLRQNIFVTTPGAIRRAMLSRFRRAFTNIAVSRLARQNPEMSARYHVSPGQKVAIFGLVLITALLLVWQPLGTFAGWNLALSAIFLAVTSLRLFAVFRSIMHGFKNAHPREPDIPDQDLPVYTILVPLYREANVLPALVRALKELDYPLAKLDIKLILEESDPETQAKAESLNLPHAFDVIVVPASNPQTKPKALNFAMQFARGKYVVIYDAEDRPEPDQLKKAIAAFINGPRDLACVQARLGIYNQKQNWLTSQFTIEYSALFHLLLPALDALGAPLPLGGTSNHFRRDRLEEVGSWDPYNVTEDADLGMRLSRFGYRSQMLDSTTFEEACSEFGNWLGQRTRWFKGWIQTYAVHMRAPIKAWQELGFGGFLTLQLMMGGILVSALVYPIFLALLVTNSFFEILFHLPAGGFGEMLLVLNIWNLSAGYIGGIALGLCGLKVAAVKGLYGKTVFIPVYWLLVSLAAYRAVWQFVWNPFYWEKTKHGQMKAKNQAPTSAVKKLVSARNIR